MFRKLSYFLAGLLVTASLATAATNLVFSFGSTWTPTGPALFQGADFQTLTDALEVVRDKVDGTATGVYTGTIGATTPASGAFTTVAASTSATVTSASANALAVGPTGATAPTFNVDNSVASNVTGLNVQGQVTTAGVFVTALGSTNEPVFLGGKGTGPVYIGGTTTTLAGLQVAQTASRVNDLLITPGATGAIPILASGGAGADANIGFAVNASGTGSVYVGGSTAAAAAVSVAHGTANVNQIILTGTNTGTAPTITVGGSGADANRDMNVAAAGTGIITLGQARATCTGTTTATCQGQRFIVSITGLTTAAAGVESAAMTVTNASVVSAASIVICNVNIYAGTGDPIATRVTPGTGTVSVTVTNVAGSGSLNATVPVACVVF